MQRPAIASWILFLAFAALLTAVSCSAEQAETPTASVKEANAAPPKTVVEANEKEAVDEEVSEEEAADPFGSDEEESDAPKKKGKSLAKPTIKTPDVIFVPTPQEVVDKMLELAEVKKGDVLYDLGCGDGRIVVTAAKKYGVKAVGFDVDKERIEESLENVERNKVGDLVTIKQEDIFQQDLSKASVVTLYLLPSLNVRLMPQLEKMKPGSRIVSHDFDMKGAKPKKVVRVTPKEPGAREHKIYLWTIPLNKEKT